MKLWFRLPETDREDELDEPPEPPKLPSPERARSAAFIGVGGKRAREGHPGG